MKRWLLLAVAALGLSAATPAKSQAFFNLSSHGFGPLDSYALNTCFGIHYHGPLYNYGPYYGGQGYLYQNVNTRCGYYTPAYPLASYGYGGGYPVASAYPVGAGYPSSSYQTPGIQTPGLARVTGGPVTAVSASAPALLPPGVGANQFTGYPSYFGQAWPGVGR